MKTKLTITLLMAGSLWGQPSQPIQLVSVAPAPVTQVTAQSSGTKGHQRSYYCVVINYPIGQSAATCSQQVTDVPDSLSASNFVSIGAPAMQGAISYDFLKESGPFVAVSCANCAIATAQTPGAAVKDTGGPYTAYTLNAAPSVTAQISLNNRDFTAPTMQFFVGGNQVSNLSIGSGGSAFVLPFIGAETASCATPSVGNDCYWFDITNHNFQVLNFNGTGFSTIQNDFFQNYSGASFSASGSISSGTGSNAPGNLLLQTANQAQNYNLTVPSAGASQTITLPVAAPTSANEPIITSTGGQLSYGGLQGILSFWCQGAVGQTNATQYWLMPGAINTTGDVCTITGAGNQSGINISYPGTMGYFRATVATAPTFNTVVTVYKGTTAQTITCTITAGTLGCNDLAHFVATATGDKINVGYTNGGGAEAAATMRASLMLF